MMSRRTFVAGVCAMGETSVASHRLAEASHTLPIDMVVKSPWLANQVALTSRNVLFLGLPRQNINIATPSLVRREADGTLRPFPGNTWNDWKPGDSGYRSFVYLNSVHIFADDTVWCVDTGTITGNGGNPLFPPFPGSQKLAQLDPEHGTILNVLRFGDDILPPGAVMNDLRFFEQMLYVTDSGLGGLIVHNRRQGKPAAACPVWGL